jgi:GAF domain-containing protein
MSATTVSEVAADALVTVLGDLAVVREISRDGEWFLPAVVRHADPARRATITATVGEFPMAVPGSGVLQTVARGSSVLKALVAQDCVHNRVDPEALQYFGEAGIHSMIVAPAFADDEVVGLVAVTRGAPAARTPAWTSSPRNGPRRSSARASPGPAARPSRGPGAGRSSPRSRACSMRARADRPCRPS